MTTGSGYSVLHAYGDGVVDSFDTEGEALLNAVNLTIDTGSEADVVVTSDGADLWWLIEDRGTARVRRVNK